MRTALLVVLALSLPALPALAESPPKRCVIQGVESLSGPAPLVPSLGRTVRAAVDPSISDDYLAGVSGVAFLATVCANNCTCRDYREMALVLNPALEALGIGFEHFEKGDDACWERIKASIADGVPVVAWNPFGDYEDTLICGYDEEKDELYGWSTKPEDSYATGSISKWRGGGMFGYIIHRGAKDGVERKKLELEQLAQVVRMDHRPAIEGG
jgi:hypothetical protein